MVELVGPDDFAVVDSGIVVRDFRSLSRSTETALDIVLLVDASESVEPRFGEVLRVVRRLMRETPLSGTDRLSVMTFSGLQPRLLCGGDCQSASSEKRLEQIRAEGATPLFDALTSAARDISGRYRAEVRQILILLSDGNDTISRASARESLDLVMAGGAILYAVNPNRESDPKNALKEIAETSGGRVLSWQDTDFLQEILAEQRGSYVVSYALPNRKRGFHTLRIFPKHNLNLRFHCRRGYYYDEVR